MRTITLEELLEAGCHFGHQVTRQNPKTAEFVFEARDNIHIIDLDKTKEGLEKAAEFIKQIASNPESTIIILGTKRQAEVIVKEELKRAADLGVGGLFSVTVRWIGGTLTNLGEVTKNYKKLKDLTDRLKNEFEKVKYTKKEISLWEKERVKLEKYYGGIKDMQRVPEVMFVIDTHSEDQAVREARKMGIPVVGIVDTNADPDPVDYIIPANDDASGSIKLIVNYIIDAWIEGKKKIAKGEGQRAEGKEETKETKEERQEANGKEQISAKSEGQMANDKGQKANSEQQKNKEITAKPEKKTSAKKTAVKKKVDS